MKSFKFVTISCASLSASATCHHAPTVFLPRFKCYAGVVHLYVHRLSYVRTADARGHHVAIVKCFNTLALRLQAIIRSRLFHCCCFIAFARCLYSKIYIHTFTYFTFIICVYTLIQQSFLKVRCTPLSSNTLK